MYKLTEIGIQNPRIAYADRPTVKALIFNEKNEVLIINNGLLPGGGIGEGEDKIIALQREILEEVGIAVSDMVELRTVIQYRDFLKKKYVIYGHTAQYLKPTNQTSPQDEGERTFTYEWYSLENAIELLNRSIRRIEDTKGLLRGDAYQGKLFNLMTTRLLLYSITKRP